MALGSKTKAARTTPATHFARRLREAREKAGLSQTELGLRIGIDPSAASPRMNQYEKGLYEPPHALVKRMADTLGVPLAYFFTEGDDRMAQFLASWTALDELSREALVCLARSDVEFAPLVASWLALDAQARQALLRSMEPGSSSCPGE